MDKLKSNNRMLIRNLTGHSDPVNACAVSPDGSFIVSAAGNVMKIYEHKNDNTLKVWDFQTGALRFTLSGHTEAVKGCAVSKNNSLIISVAEDCLILWDARTGQKVNRFECPGFACSSCTEDSTIIVVSFFIALLDFHSGKESISILSDDMLHACAVSRDGSFLVTAGTDQHLVVWNAIDGEKIAVLHSQHDINPNGDVRTCAISPDGTFIVSGSDDGILRIWDTELFKEKKVLIGHNNWITGCAVSPDNSTVVSSSLDKILKIWDVQSGNELTTLIGHTGGVNCCTFSACGRYIISAGDDMTIKVWDISES
jgi:WD40 repeat protein